MQYYITSIPYNGDRSLLDDFNKFLRTHRVIHVERHFNEVANTWNFLVEYVEGAELEDPQLRRNGQSAKRDIRAELPEKLLPRFDLLKKIRSNLFQQFKLPAAFHVFSDKELKVLTETQPLTLENIGTLSGIQRERINLYGKYFVDDAVKQFETMSHLDETT